MAKGEDKRIVTGVGMDAQDGTSSAAGAPFNRESMQQLRVTHTWEKYADRLTWGKGQCLAILDDGCDLADPVWQAELPWGRKVVAGYNSIDGNDDPTPVPPGYHGTSVGYPSSMNLDGMYGVAYNNAVAQVRCVRRVHLTGQEDDEATGRQFRELDLLAAVDHVFAP